MPTDPEYAGDVTPTQIYNYNPTPNAGAGTGPGAPQGILPSPTVAPYSPPPVPVYQATNPLSVQQFQDQITSSPQYQQQMQNIDLYAANQQKQAAFDAEWAQKFYDQNMAQLASSASSSGGGFVGEYGAGEAEAKKLDELQKAQAAHDLANQQEYTREALGSRGLANSGQGPLEQAQLQYSYDNLLKEIDLRAQARAAILAQTEANARGAAAASSRSNASSIANQQADLTLRYQYTAAQALLAQQNLAQDIAAKRGDALFQVGDKLTPYYFDPQTGAYIGAGGQVLTPQQAQQTIAPAAPPPPLQEQISSGAQPAPALPYLPTTDPNYLDYSGYY